MTLAHRAYFALVGLFAAWVGWWGWVAPADVARALPWTVPPLHARFIASLYVAGTLAMAWSLVSRRVPDVRIATWLAVVWTAALLVVSLLHLGTFDWRRPQVWFWFGAYAVYPLWGAWLLARRGAGTSATAARRDRWLVAVALATGLAGLLLLALPERMAAAWPWKVLPLVAQVYAGPFLAWSAAAWLLAGEPRPAARRIVLAALLAWAVLALAASLLHRGLFRAEAPATWIWFAAFAGIAAVAGLRLVRRGR